MEWRKGFLTEPAPRKPKPRKANALPDDAFLPTESYDLMDDDGARHLSHHMNCSYSCRGVAVSL